MKSTPLTLEPLAIPPEQLAFAETHARLRKQALRALLVPDSPTRPPRATAIIPPTRRGRIMGATLVLALVASTALAGQLTVRSRLIPGPGILQPGSSLNPYVIQDGGRVVGTIKPRVLDVDPHDGFMDPGTPMNPWVIDTDD